MSIKNLLLLICLLTLSYNQAEAVYSSINSISVEKKDTQKRTLKERLLDVWVAKKLKKQGINATFPPDLTKCLNINLKNLQVHKGYNVTINRRSVTYKKCNSKSGEITEIDLDKIESVTSTDGEEIYFAQPIEKIVADPIGEPKTHPAVIMGLVLLLGGMGLTFFNLMFGATMIFGGVLLALVTRKLLKDDTNKNRWKGMNLIKVITGLGTGLMLLFFSLVKKFK